MDKLLRNLETELLNELLLTELIPEILRSIALLEHCDREQFSEVTEALATPQDKHRIMTALTRYYALSGHSFKDSQIPILKGDGLRLAKPSLLERTARITVVLDNLRSVFNVGSIFRTSECLALGELILCGTTPTPLHPNMAKTAMGTCDKVSWQAEEDTVAVIRSLKSQGYHVYALETAQDALSVFEFRPDLPFALVLGNESLGISPEALSLCDSCLALPVLGWKNSLNVGVAFAVAAYQLVFA